MALFSRPIALSPSPSMIKRSGVGGLCIPPAELRPADIIVSTTSASISAVIRIATESVVSHAALYIGDGMVIEAIGEGVTKRGLTDAIADGELVVVYRHPDVTPESAKNVIAFASGQVGKKYSASGAVLSSDKFLCRVIGPQEAGFYCSQLVAEAFKKAKIPLSTLPSQCITPQDVVNVAYQRLIYVGHVKGDASWFPILSP